MHSTAPLCCERCARTLTPGVGDFYVVRITAVADPAPPHFTEEDLDSDLDEELVRLYDQIERLSEQELLEEVYRRRVLYLCTACFRVWIERPAG